MPGLIPFKLGTRTYTYCIHMRVNLFHDATKFGHVRRNFSFTPIEIHVKAAIIDLHVSLCGVMEMCTDTYLTDT